MRAWRMGSSERVPATKCIRIDERRPVIVDMIVDVIAV